MTHGKPHVALSTCVGCHPDFTPDCTHFVDRLGTASLDLEDRSLPGAERSVSVHVLSWTHTIGALPLRAAGPPQPSPYNPVPAGEDGAHTERLFVRCRAVIDEAAGIKTFVFAAPEPAGLGKARPVAYKPGQYASFNFLVGFPVSLAPPSPVQARPTCQLSAICSGGSDFANPCGMWLSCKHVHHSCAFPSCWPF